MQSVQFFKYLQTFNDYASNFPSPDAAGYQYIIYSGKIVCGEQDDL